MKDVQGMLPLTEAFYYILVTLYKEPSHGYGIMQEIERVTNGRVTIGAGTLYTALNTLLKKGLIENADTATDADSRRKMYAVTEDGRNVLTAEMTRLAELLENGQKALEQEGGMRGERE